MAGKCSGEISVSGSTSCIGMIRMLDKRKAARCFNFNKLMQTQFRNEAQIILYVTTLCAYLTTHTTK